MADRSLGVMLDSSVVIAHLRGKLDLFALVAPDEPLFIPLVVLGEIRKGALKSANPVRQNERIDELLKTIGVIHPDLEAADVYARTAVQLESKGRPIPENDVWIAAAALQLDMPLAARDLHFDEVEGLEVLKW